MTTQSIAYGARTALTCTLASLANNANRQSNAVDNTSALAIDYELTIKIVSGAAPTVGDFVSVWIASGDGTDFTGDATGSDGAYTAQGEGQLQLVATMVIVTAGTLTYAQCIPSVAACFGGTIPPKFSVIIENTSGQALAASGHSIEYRSVNYTYA